MTKQQNRAGGSATITVKITERDMFCIWAAVVLREPEPLTRLLKKILKPVALRLARRKKGGAKP